MIDKNTPAFPRPSGPEPRVDQYHECFDGMTYRQWLIGMALQGMLSRADLIDSYKSEMMNMVGTLKECVADSCMGYADAIIDRLNKEDK